MSFTNVVAERSAAVWMLGAAAPIPLDDLISFPRGRLASVPVRPW